MLVQCDASQLEWRVLVWLANDRVAIEEIRSGEDFHTKNQETFGLPSRLIAKVYLFRTIYRGSGWSFANDPDFIPVSADPKYWDSINKKFYGKYKDIDRCHQTWANLVGAKRPIVSPLGREWFFPHEYVQKRNWKTGVIETVLKLPWTKFTNYPVQGTGNDLMALARVTLQRRLRNLELKALIVSTVHDSIIVDCPDEEVNEVVNVMYEVFMDIPKNVLKLWSVNLPIPFPCEVKVGPDMKNMSKVPYSRY